jgi:histone-lysine N-methyltransferase SETMAR
VYDKNDRGWKWMEPNPQVERATRRTSTNKKVLLCLWWDARGPIHFELLPSGQTVDSKVYGDQLRRVQAELLKKRPSIVNRTGVKFYRDNDKFHVSKITEKLLDELGWQSIMQPSNSPDLDPSDFHLFRSMAPYLKNKIYTNLTDVTIDIQKFLSSKDARFYSKPFESLLARWQSVVDGKYYIDSDFVELVRARIGDRNAKSIA